MQKGQLFRLVSIREILPPFNKITNRRTLESPHGKIIISMYTLFFREEFFIELNDIAVGTLI